MGSQLHIPLSRATHLKTPQLLRREDGRRRPLQRQLPEAVPCRLRALVRRTRASGEQRPNTVAGSGRGGTAQGFTDWALLGTVETVGRWAGRGHRRGQRPAGAASGLGGARLGGPSAPTRTWGRAWGDVTVPPGGVLRTDARGRRGGDGQQPTSKTDALGAGQGRRGVEGGAGSRAAPGRGRRGVKGGAGSRAERGGGRRRF